MRAERASSATVSPYPVLVSRQVVPPRAASAASSRRFSASRSSVASRVAATVVAMPPAEYGRPAIRAANSAVRSPSNTRCVWLSTQPGNAARPPTSTRRSAAGAAAAAPTQAKRVPSSTTAASGSVPTSGSFVVNSPIPVSNVLTAVHLQHAPSSTVPQRRHLRCQYRGRGTDTSMYAVGNHLFARNHDVAYIGSRRRQQHSDRIHPSRPQRPQLDRDEIRRSTDRDAPDLRPPDSRVVTPRCQQLVHGEPATLFPGQPFVHFHCPRLPQRVDHCVTVTAQRECHSGRSQFVCRPDPVAEILLGRRTQTHPSTGTSQQLDVMPGQMRTMDCDSTFIQHSGLVQHPGGRPAVNRQTLVVLGTLFREMHVQRSVTR